MKTTLICLAAIALSVTAEPIQRIPLFYKRSPDGESDFRSVEGQALKNGMLGGIVQIGNPPKNFTMAFDTSTGFSWVRGEQCGNENCQGRNSYDARNSTTAISTGRSFTKDYGKGIVYSTIYADTFQFSDITVKNMTFGGAYRMENFDEGFDGFLGLGRNVNLNITDVKYAKRDIPPPGFVPAAFQQNYGLQSSQFGMYTTSVGSGFSNSGSVPSSFGQPNNAITSGGFGRAKRSLDEPAGYLIIGGIDTDAIKGKLYNIDANEDTGSGNWAVPVRQAEFEDDLEFEVDKNANAVLSTSTDVIGLPNKQADEFQKHWYAEYDEPDNTFMIPCCLMDRLTAFNIQFGGVKVSIPPSYWSHPRKVDSCCELCRTHIGRSESDTDYVIGYALTNAFYTQFDSESNKIGLAMKKSHNEEDGLEIYEA